MRSKGFGGAIPFVHNAKDQTKIEKAYGFRFRLPLSSSVDVGKEGGIEDAARFESEWKTGPEAWKACAAVGCLIATRAGVPRTNAKTQSEFFASKEDYWITGRFKNNAQGRPGTNHHPPNYVPRISLKPCVVDFACTPAGPASEGESHASSDGSTTTADRDMFASSSKPVFQCAEPSDDMPWGSQCWVAAAAAEEEEEEKKKKKKKKA